MRESSPERAEASADAQGSACHVGSAVWVAEGTGSASEGGPAVPSSRKKPGRWLKGTVVAVGGTASSRTLTVETEDGRTLAGVPEPDCPLQNSRDDTLDDLVRADFLHEPG
jgi:myosin-5